MDYFYMIDREKAMDYILEVAYKKNMPQRQLAEGICDVSNLNKICNKKNGRLATLEMIQLFCQKLDISYQELELNCLFKEPFKVNSYMETMRWYTYRHEYQQLEQMVKDCENISDFHTGIGLQFYLWHKAIVEIELYHNPNRAIALCEESLSITQHPPFDIIVNHSYSEREIEILSTRNICFTLIKKYDLAIKYYQQLIEITLNKPCLANKDLIPKLYYNLCVGYSIIGDSNSVIQRAEEAIQYCTQRNGRYLHLPFLYYTCSVAYQNNNCFEKASDYFNKSYQLFLIQNMPNEFLNQLLSLKTKYNIS